MDISDTLIPNSDQLDAVELLSGPRIFTIANVSRHNAEQPVNIHLAEFPRVWRPGKSMRRVLASCWGVEASAWTGRRVELYCDPAVRFGSEAVGGTRISRLSHIDKQKKIPLLVTRGKSATFVVDPLPEPTTAERATPRETPADTGDPITDPQKKKMHASFNDLAVTDRAERLRITQGIVGIDNLQSANDLTKDQASHLIDVLEQAVQAGDPASLYAAAGLIEEPPA